MINRTVIAALAATIAAILTWATPAAAQDITDTPWWPVALCESGGDPTINTGNGFYGLVQFLPSTWDAVAEHAGRPDLVGTLPHHATAWDQLRMAEHLAFAMPWGGLGHWPVCGAHHTGARTHFPDPGPAGNAELVAVRHDGRSARFVGWTAANATIHLYVGGHGVALHPNVPRDDAPAGHNHTVLVNLPEGCHTVAAYVVSPDGVRLLDSGRVCTATWLTI